LTGGSDNWVSTAPTIKVSSAGTAISGVKEYEYYKSTSSTAPTDSTTATGTTTTGEVTISDEGTTYIWYRTVSNNGFKSAWSSFQVTNLDTINTTFDSYEIKNLTSTGYDIYLYGVRSPGGVERVQFPTWTIYGGQDDLDYSWPTSSFCAGTNLGNGTWKYHVSASDHNNEAGQYETDIYIYGKNNTAFAIGVPQFLKTDNYAGSLYLSASESEFNNDKSYFAGVSELISNFTYEFDAKPTTTTTIYSNGAWALNGSHNFIIFELNTGNNTTNAGIGLTLGTNGAVAIAHAGGYYYALLNYTGNLSAQHRYRFTVKNNVPYLYIDGTLIASGIEPVSPIITLVNYSTIGTGSYGSYKGWANNFVLYSTAR